jgi:hypothetical protein
MSQTHGRCAGRCSHMFQVSDCRSPRDRILLKGKLRLMKSIYIG